MNLIFIDIPSIPRIPDREFERINKLKYELYDERLSSLGLSNIQRRHKSYFTYGLLSIASQFSGENVFFLNYQNIFNDSGFRRLISTKCIIGITCLTPAYNIVKEICKFIKEINQHSSTIVLGGYHVTFSDVQTLVDNKYADIIVKGPGEKPFREIVEGRDWNLIPGLSFRHMDKIVSNEIKLDYKFYNVDYSLLPHDLNEYNYNVFSTQGCNFRCAFCVNPSFWGNVKLRSIYDVISELKYLNSFLPENTLLHFSDNVFGVIKNHYHLLLQLIIESNLKLKFSCDIRAKCIDEQIIKLMEKAGFVKCSIGFEDSLIDVLHNSNKGLTYEDNIATAKLIRNNSNLVIEAYWLVGLPGTTFKSMRQNKLIIKDLLDKRIIDIVATSLKYIPLPGTEIFQHPEKFSLEILSENWEDYARHKYNFTYKLKMMRKGDLRNCLLEMEDFLINYYQFNKR